jgi:hypothetical protein
LAEFIVSIFGFLPAFKAMYLKTRRLAQHDS